MATIAYPITKKDVESVSPETIRDLEDLLDNVERTSKNLHIQTWYSHVSRTNFIEITDED